MNRRLVFWCLILGCLGSLTAQTPPGAGDVFEILRVYPNGARRTLDVEVRAFRKGQRAPLVATDLSMTQDSLTALSIRSIDAIPDGDTSRGTHIIHASLGNQAVIYKGEPHELKVVYRREQVRRSRFAFGSPSNPVNFVPVAWMEVVIIGMLIVSGLLLLFSQLIPVYNQYQFKRKYVKKYKEIKQPGVRRFDPITGDEFEDEELVVAKCRRITSMTSWEYNGFQCPDYPDCMLAAEPCTHGQTKTAGDNFFAQQGDFRKLNWLWYGSLGGLMAWGVWALLQNIELPALSSLMAAVAGSQATDFGFSLLRDTLMGLALGLGLTFTLSIVEDRGTSSRTSWSRVLLRTLLGALVAPVVFLGGYFLHQILPSGPGQLAVEYLGSLLVWILFGLALGLVLSVRSTISAQRGILGGVIASAIAFNIFFWLSFLFQAFELPKMIAFVALGAVLGYTIVSVVSRLEDFELEYVSPAKFSRVNPISKWLKADMDIFIGTDPGCYVFIKWNDEFAQARHARLSYQNGHVSLEPLAETVVNGQVAPLNKPTVLKDGDIIQLGRQSISRMRYKEKRSSGPPSRQQPSSGASSSSSGGGSSRNTGGSRSADRPRPEIRISKRVK
ncbi:MAG: FHA domain-containing protein [Bacteroidia bacterium]|nr:FHA domain-containing protein [Bacteroidia bacterium]